MKVLQVIEFGCAGIVDGCVVAHKDQFDALQAQHSVRFWPAAVVTDTHPQCRVQCIEYRKPQITGLEVALFQMLKGEVGFMLAMSREVNLAILPRDLAGLVNEYRGVEPPGRMVVANQFSITEIKSNSSACGSVE